MNTRNLIGGLLAGTAVGVAIGLLLAPASGKETRRKLTAGSRKLTDSIKGSVEDSIDSLKDRFSTTGLEEATRKGKEAYNSAKDSLKV